VPAQGRETKGDSFWELFTPWVLLKVKHQPSKTRREKTSVIPSGYLPGFSYEKSEMSTGGHFNFIARHPARHPLAGKNSAG